MDSNKLKENLPLNFRVTTRNATTRIKWTARILPCPDCKELVDDTRRVTYRLERNYYTGQHIGWVKKCSKCDLWERVISPISTD